MRTVAAPPYTGPAIRRFDNGRDWIAALGDVPLDRVVFDPLPGTATEDDLLALVEGHPKRLCELIEKTLVEKPVGLHEATVASELAFEIKTWNRANGDLFVVAGADATLRMATIDRIRLPDVAVFARARLPAGRLPPERVPTLAPDLAVEVVSEGNTDAEMRQKLIEYFANGTRLAWYVYPDRRVVLVHREPSGPPHALLGEADTLDGGEILPGFALPVATIFRDLPS